eukprot:TRINITY_DN13990_c0_g1_i3.p1 TRINITY_DN13990_c0_g1~~TRINITY_DN13990_c0_g1_i3.p1  ORF type:complete len:552 (+),score=120.59 TRINITY_DN13990_c0_g1_i3:318-1973(+)
MVDDHLTGYNAALFAYGQSGGGKTYSLLGRDGILEGQYTGIIPRTVKHLFDRAALLPDAVQFSVSFFEIYKDEVYDLLHMDPEGKSVRIPGREERHMSRLKEFVVDTLQDATQVLGVGRDQRRYAPMPMNPVSSRSHGVFVIHSRRQYADKSWSKASFYFVDLMGSEALVEDGSCDLGETTAVNRDLLALKRVITALGKKQGEQHSVPAYRESTLTWVLRDVLGGNSRAMMLLTGSAHALQYHATQNTLEFGTALKGVRRAVTACSRQLGVKELEQIVTGLRFELAQKDAELVLLKGSSEGLAGDTDLLVRLEENKGTIKELQERTTQLEEQLERERREWLSENEAMATRLRAVDDLVQSGASAETLAAKLEGMNSSPKHIEAAAGEIKAARNREADVMKKRIAELEAKLNEAQAEAVETVQEHDFQIELLEKSRETAVSDADNAETRLLKAEERNAMLQRLLQRQNEDGADPESPERDVELQPWEEVDPTDPVELLRHLKGAHSKLDQCEREKEDAEEATADLKEKVKEQLFCLKMAQQSLKIRDFMSSN